MQRFIIIASLCTILAACSSAPQSGEVASAPQPKEVASVPQCKDEPVVGSNIRRTRPCNQKREENSEAAQQHLRDLRAQQADQIRAGTPASTGR